MLCHNDMFFFYCFFSFYRPFKYIDTTTYCLHSLLSLAVFSESFTLSIFRSSFILSTHLCMGCPLVLYCVVFYAVICPISPSDLHTCPVYRVLFKVPTMLDTLYSFSTFLLLLISFSSSLFLFRPNIFLNILLSNTFNLFSSDFVVVRVLLAYRATGLTKTLYNITFDFHDNNLDLNNGINP